MPQNIRSEKRYRVPDSTYLHLQSEHDIIGRILDISTGGMGFEYVQLWDSDKITAPETLLSINILDSRNYLLKEAPCKVAYCHDIHSESPFAGTVPMFKCGMQFQQLTQAQTSQLHAILDACKQRENRNEIESAFNLSKFAATSGKQDTAASPD